MMLRDTKSCTLATILYGVKSKNSLILLSSVMRTTNFVFKVYAVLFWVVYMLVCLQWRSIFQALTNLFVMKSESEVKCFRQ